MERNDNKFSQRTTAQDGVRQKCCHHLAFIVISCSNRNCFLLPAERAILPFVLILLMYIFRSRIKLFCGPFVKANLQRRTSVLSSIFPVCSQRRTSVKKQSIWCIGWCENDGEKQRAKRTFLGPNKMWATNNILQVLFCCFFSHSSHQLLMSKQPISLSIAFRCNR